MLKAITASLLMEQVLAQNFNFKTKTRDDNTREPGVIEVDGFKEPSIYRVRQIVTSDLNDRERPKSFRTKPLAAPPLAT